MKDSLDPVTLYFKEVKNLPELPFPEFLKLFKKYQKGDKTAKNKLVEANLRLVIPIAKRYYRRGIDFLDLIEEGNLGLMHALEKFEPKKGFRFSTYSAYWIEQSIRRAVDEQSKTIRIPPHAWEILRKWMREWDRLRGKFGRTPTMTEMAREMQLSARQIKGVMDAAEAARGIGSLESPLDEDENLSIKDVLSDNRSSPDEILSLVKVHEELEKALEKLPVRERSIIEMRFGIKTYRGMTLDKVGKKYGLSRERVRQLEQRALLRLKRTVQRMGLT
ncbi:MAG: RNA polymerase sigma factor RpoD/SigA [bacterium]